jgi:LemA protein
MLIFGILGSLLVLAALVWAVWIYNRLVRDRHRVLAAWSDIDVQLKRRHDLIPKLIEAVRGYTAYEQATLQTLTALRTRSRQTDDPKQRGPMEAELSVGMHRLLALAEAYPDLKASSNFLELQREITSVEDFLQHARRYYNGAVRNLNTRIDSFPDLLLARALNYRYAAYFQLEDARDDR